MMFYSHALCSLHTALTGARQPVCESTQFITALLLLEFNSFYIYAFAEGPYWGLLLVESAYQHFPTYAKKSLKHAEETWSSLFRSFEVINEYCENDVH